MVTLPAIAFVLVHATVLPDLPLAILWLCVGLLTAWAVMVHWRGWLVFKAFARSSDRQYDRKDKFALPPEYRDTESATAAAERRKKSHG